MIKLHYFKIILLYRIVIIFNRKIVTFDEVHTDAFVPTTKEPLSSVKYHILNYFLSHQPQLSAV